jgi:hypothetical protein
MCRFPDRAALDRAPGARDSRPGVYDGTNRLSGKWLKNRASIGENARGVRLHSGETR